MSPLWHQSKLREFCKGKGIHVTAYSPLGAVGTMWGHSNIVESDVIAQIAKAKGKTTAQVIIYYHFIFLYFLYQYILVNIPLNI